MTQKSQSYGQLANYLIGTGVLGTVGTLAATQSVPKALAGSSIAVASGILASYAGPAIASKFLSRTVGATGIRNVEKTARMLEKLKDIPTAQALSALTEYANTGKEPDFGTSKTP